MCFVLRFHILCAHYLCEADMNSFDAKINTENLTKCLQTLKQFYGDLYKDKVTATVNRSFSGSCMVATFQ